jgi:[acyl-carrier-protein] S-malonyltransferase
MKQRLLVIAPGRGTYARNELGILSRTRPFSQRARSLLSIADQQRQAAGQPSITELDSAPKFKPTLHQAGAHASALIFTLSAMDFATLEDSLGAEVEIVAVLGNSMGWYSSLFTSGALSFEDAYRIVEFMGQHQKQGLRGGQLIYPICDENWVIDPARLDAVHKILEDLNQTPNIDVSISIYLGGFVVLAGNEDGLTRLNKALEPIELGSNRFPFRLAMHSAFHSTLLTQGSEQALAHFHAQPLTWQRARYPLIDGRGFPWLPFGASNPNDLLNYTLGHQVTQTYNFSAAVRIALREYNPSQVVLLGPGSTLGSSIAQVMIDQGWGGLHNKDDFMKAQNNSDRPLVALGRDDQRADLFSKLSVGA